MCAPAGTVAVVAELNGGAVVGQSWFDNVRLREMPPVANGSFDLGSAGWTTEGSVSGGKLVLSQNEAVSAPRSAARGTAYFLSLQAQGSGTMGLRFLNSEKATIQQYDKTITTGTNGLCAYAPADTKSVSVVLSGSVTVDEVARLPAPSGTSMPDGDFERFSAGAGPPWELDDAVVGFVANQAGQSTEGLMGLGVKLFGAGQGGVRSSMVRAEGGLAYEAQAMVRGAGAELSVEFWSDEFRLLDSRETAINAADWSQASVAGTAPEGTAYVSLSEGGSGVGEAYLDEAFLTPVVRTIGSNLQLFLDDWLVGKSSGVQRTFQPGEKTDMLVSGGWYGNVVWNPDKGLYEMWHQASGYSLLYRTSTDGVNWSKERKCTAANNIADPGVLPSPTVFLDLEERDPARRYKLVCYNYGQGGYDLHFSADGVAFTRYDTFLPGSDVITVTYDAVNREYIATHKVMPSNTNNKRTHSIAVSKDLIHWTEGVRMYNIGTQEDILGTDYLRADIYGTSMYALGDSYVGLNWRFLLNENDGYSGKMDVPLMFSRDLTEEWQRMYRADGVAVVADPAGGDNTCLQVTVENDAAAATGKRYILVTAPKVSGDYVLEFDYMPTHAGTNPGSGFLDVYLSNKRSNYGRIGLGSKTNHFIRLMTTAGNTGNMTDPAGGTKVYPLKDNTWYRVRMTVTGEGYSMELWKKGQEATTKGVVATPAGTATHANTSTNVEFCFGPYSSSQVADLSAPLVNYIDNITITPYNKVTAVQPERGGSIRVDADYARAGQTVRVETEVEPGRR